MLSDLALMGKLLFVVLLVEMILEHPESFVAHDAAALLLGVHEQRGSPAQGHRAMVPVG